MPPRLAACEPCRSSKVSCDHQRPVCTRCQEANKHLDCVYRTRPFKKRKIETPEANQSAHIQDLQLQTDVATTPSYPNAGYLGSSSHATIYDHIDSEEPGRSRSKGTHHQTPTKENLPQLPSNVVSRGVAVLRELQANPHFKGFVSLVETWPDSGTNMALASALTILCAEATKRLFNSMHSDLHSLSDVSRRLSKCSLRPLLAEPASSFQDYMAQFTGSNTRWETLGLFFTAVSRAMSDVDYHPPLYTTPVQRSSLQRLSLHYSDACLDKALSLDCLNDLQLILQYENFIAHSQANGDQSYQSWRRLGDVISSLFALGYHDHIGANTATPAFLVDIQRSLFARAYSADKNLSIFLGRPTRLHRSFCHFILPLDTFQIDSTFDVTKLHEHCHWPSPLSPDFVVGTKWFALCALLKEELLGLNRETNDHVRATKSRAIEQAACALWETVPSDFRMDEPLTLCNRSPMHRDLRLSIKLDYLHVRFLVHSSASRKASYSNRQLITLAADTMVQVSRSMVMKQHLVNSGTSLIWKIIYYGVPAAGILCLALLHHRDYFGDEPCSLMTTVQSLSIFVAEIETGALVQREFANFELLSEAARTVKSVLRRVLSQHDPGNLPVHKQTGYTPAIPELTGNDWTPWSEQGLWDFEMDFWSNLADHPFLVDDDTINSMV